MKKVLSPLILLILAVAVGAYLMLDVDPTGGNFDAEAYLQTRAKVDSLEIALWENQKNSDAQVAIRAELEASWDVLGSYRTTSDNSEPVTYMGLTTAAWKWIAGGVALIILCLLLLVGLRKGKDYVTRKMETIKMAEPRFKETKEGLENDPTLTAPRPRPQRKSIIADAEEFANSQRQAAQAAAAAAASAVSGNAMNAAGEPSAQPAQAAPSAAPNVEFEDENGVPENKILTTDLNRPALRPTARERITSAMQSLSDVLRRSPQGISRDRTMKIRAQSRNTTGDPNLNGSHPLDTNRFDREFTEKSKVLQLSRRGLPASAIASHLKIPQERVEAIVKESLESGT